MLRVVFFARVREELGCDALEVTYPAGGIDLDRLQEQLCKENAAVWRSVLEQDNMIRAVNHIVITENADLHDGDEVAFFPPVTGG